MRETALSSVDGHYRWLPGSDGRQIRAGAPRPLGAAKSNEWVYLLTLEKAGWGLAGWDALVYLAVGGHSADPQVTDLFLSAGCRTNLDGCKNISDGTRLRFDQILKEHAEWKENLDRMSAEHSPTDAFYGPDWGR